jgi:hypothetical protein
MNAQRNVEAYNIGLVQVCSDGVRIIVDEPASKAKLIATRAVLHTQRPATSEEQ